jgi:hypothetical protein
VLAKQRASDGDISSDALRKDIARLQQQIYQRDTDASSTTERAATAAAAAAAADNAIAQLRCDALVAQAREEALLHRADAAAQRLKTCEQDLKVFIDKNASLLQEVAVVKAAHEEQIRVGQEVARKHKEHVLKLEEELEAEHSRGAKLATVVSSFTSASSKDAEAIQKELEAARCSAISNRDQVAELTLAAVAHGKQMRASVDLQAQLQQQVVQLTMIRIYI